MEKIFLSDDKNVPDKIEHGCDIIYDSDGELEQYYNYLVYHFSGLGFDLRARVYLDEMGIITLSGQVSKNNPRSISHEYFLTKRGQEILMYLQRRYSEVRLSGGDKPYIFPQSIE